MDELNPNHPVTMEMHDHWHKIVAVLLSRPEYGGKTEITVAEIDAWAKKYEGWNVVVKSDNDKLTLWLISPEEGRKLAREAGGLPA